MSAAAEVHQLLIFSDMYKKSPAKAWRQYKSRYTLTGTVCGKCGKKDFPAAQFCRFCHSPEQTACLFAPLAKLITWSTLQVAPEGYEAFLPYTVAIIELEKGVRITTQLSGVNPGELKPGLRLKPVFRKIYEDGEEGVIHYGLKFTKFQST